MKNPTRKLAGILLISMMLGAGSVSAGAVQLRDDPIWDKGISLNLKDAEIRQVFVLAFEIAGQPVIIDDCVQGNVTLEFENVSLRDALTSLTRMGRNKVRPRSEGYYVGCIDAEPGAGEGVDEQGQGHRLDFVLRDVTNGEIVTRPSLLVLANSLAEIEVGGVPTEDLDDTGEFYLADPRASLHLKVYLEIDEDGVEPDLLRGLLEMNVTDNVDRRLMRAAAMGFDIALPPGSADVTVAEVELGGRSYSLAVTRRKP